MDIMAIEDRYGAHNYSPLPVVLSHGKGAYVWDINDKRYLDMMSAYSAVSHGHCHPRLVATLIEQAKHLNVISRAYYSDRLAPLLQKICQLTNQYSGLPMNSGTEAVETALKAARKWAYEVKNIPENKAEIIVCKNNFHGRTITIISFSCDALYKHGFGPYTPNFKIIPYGDAHALETAITPHTAAFLVEPIQGEGGIIIPPKGYLKQCATICEQNNVLFIADEIQTGLGRTGKLFACQHENVQPDGLILGKALGGGLIPLSMFLGRKDIMALFNPGSHGSTFGGNPLACAVGLEALNILMEDKLADRSAELGDYFLKKLMTLHHPAIKDIRGKGLFIGMEFDKEQLLARDLCMKLLDLGILTKETHKTVIRLTPPLIITKEQLDWAFEQIKTLLS